MISATELKKLLSSDKIAECVEQLFAQIEIARKLNKEQAETFFDSLIGLNGEFAETVQDKRDGIINISDYRIQKNSLRKRITTFINQLPDDYFEQKEQNVVKAKASLRELIALDDKSKKYNYDVFLSFSHKDE
ncbi:MAG: hypothetical protein KAI79_17655, partial [Bacteroidales bacterium]|nr:hypothetical protein [Bacteroidales bacterium]